MTLLDATSAPATADRIARVPGPDGLDALRAPGIGAALWERRLPADAAAALDAASPSALPACRTTLAPDDAAEAVAAAGRAAGTPEAAIAFLAADVAALARRFSDLMAVARLELRLAVVRRATCPRWHADAVRARLLCAYRGAGTLIGPAGAGGAPTRIESLPRGTVAVLRGSAWPGAERTALVHRSPAVEDETATRLLLALDPDDEAST